MTVLKNMEFEMIDGIELLDTVCQDVIPAVIVVPPDNTFSSYTASGNQVNVDTLTSSDESSVNLEYCEVAKPTQGGRSRKKINTRQKNKNIKNKISTQFEIKCKHSIENSVSSKICMLKRKLTYDDCKIFNKKLSDIQSKIEQDKFILSFMSIDKAKRTNRKKIFSNRTTRAVYKYCIPTSESERVPVCLDAFVSVTNITKRRINILGRHFFDNQVSPVEKRGGCRITPNTFEISESIVNHIETFRCRKSHHTRKDTGRSYLPPELNVTLMWSKWQAERKSNDLQEASFSKYYNIFTNQFNISFGHPRQDVCSFCTEKISKISVENDKHLKNEMKLELKTHQALSKFFFKMMYEKNENEIICSFDMMQNQALPKLSVTDTFYSRQAWLYNLTFVSISDHQTAENVDLYTWLETQSGRGPNEVCSALLHFLEQLENKLKVAGKSPKVLKLFSDSAQNKNQFVMTLLLYFINYKSTIFSTIKHIFPVRGHSYMPPDQVFGRIEQKLRKIENILSPTTYHDIFRESCTVWEYGKDFEMLDFKTNIKNVIKSKLGFKSTEQKIFTYTKGDKLVGISSSYEATPTRIQVLKRGANLENLNDVLKLAQINHVKEPKQNDIRNLMKYFTVPDEAKEFYNDIFKPNIDEINNDFEDENGVFIYSEDTH